ncbi:hypothetical protein C1X61_04335 [Pseudomonas sp. FW215-T2]|nr:hypothetical protein C1X61_04335 [Pseudomonas sp. FW215-T2]PNA14252.1 hypothetical protein C1X62_07355 [Pseudomonas sp. FW215-R3]PNB38853.1 hypothetical protein C1X63_05355 [Pseudomonas sp. FW305-131]
MWLTGPNNRHLALNCGSGLARESGVTVNNNVECYGLFASKPAPTLVYGVLKFGENPHGVLRLRSSGTCPAAA